MDPLAEQTMTPYQYVNNNPVMFIDPTGMNAEDPPINLYLIEKRNGTDLKYHHSKGGNQIELVGSNSSYYATPYHDKDDKLVGFGVTTGEGRLDYVISKSEFNDFMSGIDNYRNAADMLHANGVPSDNMLDYMIAAQDGSFSGMAKASYNMWKEPGAVANAVLTSLSAAGGGLAFSRGAKNSITSFDDIVNNPKALWGKSSTEVGQILGEGWKQGAYGSSKTGWKFTTSTDGKSVFYHPGGGRHVGSYYGFSSGTLGKTKVVGKDYVPLKGDKATIIKK